MSNIFRPELLREGLIVNHTPCQGVVFRTWWPDPIRIVIGSGSKRTVMGLKVSYQLNGRGESAWGFSPVCREGIGSHEAVYLGVGGHRQEEPGWTKLVLHLGEA